MIAEYEDLTPNALAGLGFDNPVQACRLLQEMAGHDIPDRLYNGALAALIPALAQCADPDRAVANLVRWAEAVGSRATAYQFLASAPQAAIILATVLAASQFFADILIRNPEYLEALTNARMRASAHDAAMVLVDLQRLIALGKTANAQRDALRRAKGPEILRIGVRDLLGEAAMPVIAREISDFADAAVQAAFTICISEIEPPPPSFAVIAMGKLGGQELNYSSDIDLIFVHGDQENAQICIKLAESVRDTLAKSTASSYVFRVDLRLRPEGRFGPVSRSLDSCRAYYESWAEPWEMQALIKARWIAGDAKLGAAFIQMIQEFVYKTHVDEAIIASIQQNKRRLEQKIARTGHAAINVKEGVGGIRDIEFPIQLLQLLAGGCNPEVRSGNTLTALARLSEIGLIRSDESEILAGSYQFLRTVEHRLQLLDDRAVRILPEEASALRKFGRGLGYETGEDFMADYRRHTSQVLAVFERLFYQRNDQAAVQAESSLIADWLLGPDDERAADAVRLFIKSKGFVDIDGTAHALRHAVVGTRYGEIPPDARDAFAILAERLLDSSAVTADPDKALRGIDLLAHAAPSPAVIYRMLAENPTLLSRFCKLASESGSLWQILLTNLEFLDMLADDEIMSGQLQIKAAEMTPSALARMAQRARLHIGARDIWGLATLDESMSQITHLAELIISTALIWIRREDNISAPLAVIGMGKLGGSELGYGSDWDVVYVGEPDQLPDATRLAKRLQQFLSEGMLQDGVTFQIDARLRPDGQKGALVLDIPTYRDYYGSKAATWEKQALIKSQFTAGDKALGQQFGQIAQSTIYSQPATPAEIDEIRAMKRRIEKERAQGPNDLKLGPGGLSDVEWTAQLLQLRHGSARRRLRVPGTLAALVALRDDAIITQADWEGLDTAYRLAFVLRNRQVLNSGVSSRMGGQIPEEVALAMDNARNICLRLFYGEFS